MGDKIFADLHVHSTASDGVLTPTNLLKQAHDAGLSVIGLTDHDTLCGIPEAIEAGKKFGTQVVPGIELSCGWPDKEFSLHVVGLFVDPFSVSLTRLLKNQQRSRFTRAMSILDKLGRLDIDVQPLREKFLADKDRVLGRPHVARYLREIAVVPDFQEAFNRFLGQGRPAYVPKEQVIPEDGIRAIQGAGGLAVIAHPGLIPDWHQIWKKVESLPWDGIEVFYSEHSASSVDFFRNIAKERGLGMAGGSDFHGDQGKHAHQLGLFGLPEDYFRDLETRAQRRKIDSNKD